MAKLIVIIALICMAFALVQSGPNRGSDRRGSHGSSSSHGNGGQWMTKFCANTSVAQQFIVQTQQLITNLQGNGTYADVLAKRVKEISYINDANNVALLTSNCTGYVSGLKAAKDLDKQAEEQRRQYYRTAANLFRNIVKSFFGSNADQSDEDN